MKCRKDVTHLRGSSESKLLDFCQYSPPIYVGPTLGYADIELFGKLSGVEDLKLHQSRAMPRKKFRVDTLKRPRIRQSWHPVNLYNLSRQELQFTRERTFFQQKWTAKSLTRPYHGEQIREGQWELQFSRRIPAVVPMDAAVLAKSDGSDMAAGRGSGKEEKGSASRSLPKSTPYMSMAFFPQERRLDTCIFRALFASSIRQARNMVSHGHVKVNGKKVRNPFIPNHHINLI